MGSLTLEPSFSSKKFSYVARYDPNEVTSTGKIKVVKKYDVATVGDGYTLCEASSSDDPTHMMQIVSKTRTFVHGQEVALDESDAGFGLYGYSYVAKFNVTGLDGDT